MTEIIEEAGKWPEDIQPINILIYKYPLIFRAAANPRRYSHTPIAHRGLECGQGWYPIIEDLAVWLEEEASALKAAGKRLPVPVITQVKEKLGTLTVHVSGFPPKRFFAELLPRLNTASGRSKTVCEICGAAGTSHEDGYMRTRCDKCEAKANRLA